MKECSLKVSIITVVFNGAHFIEQTIRSVLAQSYLNIQYIIIDNQSTDGTLDIINRYADRVLLVSEKDKGIYDAMNKGIALANGELIGILNSDDWYDENAVELMVNALESHPECTIFHGLLRFIDSQGNVREVVGHHHSFLKNGMIEHPSCFVHRRVYENLKYNTDYLIVADYDLMIRANQQGFKFHLVEHVIANFRDGGKSTSFQCARETLAIQQEHHFISIFKQYILTLYFWLKLAK